MNERIRELDKQAVDYALSVCDADGVYQGKEYLSVVKEKFAELIVRECANYLDTFNKENMVEEGMDGAYMKAHFGVEE